MSGPAVACHRLRHGVSFRCIRPANLLPFPMRRKGAGTSLAQTFHPHDRVESLGRALPVGSSDRLKPHTTPLPQARGTGSFEVNRRS